MMNEDGMGAGGYVSYEYRALSVPKEQVSLYKDCYPCFGWETDPHHDTPVVKRQEKRPGAGVGSSELVELFFRRDRNISNKAELTRLQRNFDSCAAELTALKRSKTTQGTIAALVIGLLGTVFMGGATFAAVAQPPLIGLMILLAVPGFAGWIAPCFVYRSLVRRRSAELDPLIEQKYDEIDEICKKGSGLQYGGVRRRAVREVSADDFI